MSPAVADRVDLGARLAALPTAYRAFALAGAATLTGAYLQTLYHVVDVVGGPGGLELFVAVVAGSLGLASVLGQTLRLRYALVLGGLFMLAGLGAYVLAIPEGAIDLGRQFRDTVALVTGLSVLRMTKAAVWALGFTPGPLFVSTYLFLRRRYALGVVVGGGALAFFVSTGDVGVVRGLVGALGAVAALGFGRLDVVGGSPAQRDAVVALLVAVLVVTTSVSLVPGGQARPLLPADLGDTVESSLVGGGDSVTVRGSIELSPAVRFTVAADRPAKWRVGAFDRYTGSGWVRSGQTRPYDGPLNRPVNDRIVRNRQTFRVQSTTAVMPAAWKPVRLESGTERALVTSMGAFEPSTSLVTGDSYTVVSHQAVPSRDALRSAGTDYPPGLQERYTQLPASTPDRVRTFTTQLTAEAANPYDTARVVEQWLEANKDYSLTVDRPAGDVAASFVFEMDRGYCVYYATAMVAMLRSQGVPARFVVGYTAGQAVDDGRWVVRGLDSHAWVEAYFPGQGWIAFDPTPAGPRAAAERARLDQARAAGVPGVDTGGSDQQELTPAGGDLGSSPTGETPGIVTATGGTPTIPPGLLGGGGGDGGASDPAGGLPDGRSIAYGLILLLGAATAVQRTGALDRSRRLVWVRRRPDGPPASRVEGTFERLDYLLGREYRPRAPGETPRAYLAAIRGGVERRSTGGTGRFDRRLDRLFDLHERAHYAGRATAEEADRAWRLFSELREEWSAWR